MPRVRHAAALNAQHLHQTNRWGTPAEWVERARVALDGRIALDPMSSEEFNQTVKAERFYTEADDCFAQPWYATTLFLNPAGGVVRRAWRKLVTEYVAGNVKRAVWVGFSLEQLCLLADELVHPLDYSWLFPRKRIPFYLEGGKRARSPTHSNYIVGLGISHARFVSAFACLGKVGIGAYARHAHPQSGVTDV